jgi:hypothetical protein
MFEYAAISFGSRLGYYTGQMNNLADDINELKPSILPG